MWAKRYFAERGTRREARGDCEEEGTRHLALGTRKTNPGDPDGIGAGRPRLCAVWGVGLGRRIPGMESPGFEVRG